MISKLMQINTEQEAIIKRQAGIIDELFSLLCRYVDMDDIEPLLYSIKSAAEKTERLKGD